MNRLIAALCFCGLVSAARAGEPDYDQRAAAIADKAITWLRAQQDAKTGGWSVPKDGGGPAYPAVTALALNGMLMQPGLDAKDAAVAKGVAYIFTFHQPDGGFYDKILPSYNTSIVLSCLARVDTPEAKAAVKPAQDFLRSLQFGEGSSGAVLGQGESAKVSKEHPFYGGIGYGREGAPDLSNTSFFLQAMHDSGVPGDDPAFQRALVFLSRVQMVEKGPDGKTINDMPYAKGSRQGGFIYSTSQGKEKLGTGDSKTGTIEETLDDGTKVSRLRAYGSMTYAGFKSLIYAQLPASDPRVTEAMRWIRENYTLAENPGIGKNGVYYYFLTFARAMHASGQTTISVVPKKDGGPRAVTDIHDWRHDLIDRLAELQEPDGSFRSMDDRWLENNKVLITAYSLIALQNARQQQGAPSAR